MATGVDGPEPIHVSIPATPGGTYPCPKDDGGTLSIIEATDDRLAGAWCPVCGTVYRELGEVSMDDLDAMSQD